MDNLTSISLELNLTSFPLPSNGRLLSSSVPNSTSHEGLGDPDLEQSILNAEGPTFMSDQNELALYLKVTCLIFLLLIFTVGTVGNVMVTMVIGVSRDMRTSTNIFLVNLSVADLLVLVVCTPTALIEVTIHPDRWILGFGLCKFVPLLEATVANASVLTILAISFERYYAICRPLRANYVCTKSRAACISIAAWALASIITSPMILMIRYNEGVNEYGEWTARCDVAAGTFWPDLFTVATVILFFLLPFAILLVTYGMIAYRLTRDRSNLTVQKNENYKARKQVVVMLGSVCVTFFLCLLPFRLLTLFVILADTEVLANHVEAYQNAVYFSRLMVYLNSCLNPILYNVMSSKFRHGFLRLCTRGKSSPFMRHGTFISNTTTNSTTMSINLGHQSTLSIPFGNGNRRGSSRHHHHLHSPELNGSLLRKNNVLCNGNNNCNGKIEMKATLKNCLLSQSSINSNGFLSGSCSSSSSSSSSHKPPGGVGVGSVALYPFQDLPSSLRNGTGSNNWVKMNNGGSNNAVKSDAVYSAYIPGKRSETVL